LVCRPPAVGGGVVAGDDFDVAVVGAGPVVVVSRCSTLPVPVPSVVDDAPRTAGDGAGVGVVEGAGECPGVVLGEVVSAGALVAVVVVPEVLVARTESGEKVGWPEEPSISVAPNVQASTLPGRGR
jgi:hypothetical protein